MSSKKNPRPAHGQQPGLTRRHLLASTVGLVMASSFSSVAFCCLKIRKGRSMSLMAYGATIFAGTRQTCSLW